MFFGFRIIEEMILYIGGAIGYWRGDIKGLIDDIGCLKPTVFCGVPRVFERVYAGVITKVEEGNAIKKLLFNWGFQRKLHALDAGFTHETAAPLFDALVFSKVKERLGGRVKLIVSGECIYLT
jgi:long-chain acyl-CoA synthetase